MQVFICLLALAVGTQATLSSLLGGGGGSGSSGSSSPKIVKVSFDGTQHFCLEFRLLRSDDHLYIVCGAAF